MAAVAEIESMIPFSRALCWRCDCHCAGRPRKQFLQRAHARVHADASTHCEALSAKSTYDASWWPPATPTFGFIADKRHRHDIGPGDKVHICEKSGRLLTLTVLDLRAIRFSDPLLSLSTCAFTIAAPVILPGKSWSPFRVLGWHNDNPLRHFLQASPLESFDTRLLCNIKTNSQFFPRLFGPRPVMAHGSLLQTDPLDTNPDPP